MLIDIISTLKSKLLFNKSSIGQIFIISKEIDTFFCFNNYQNFLFPEEKRQLTYTIRLFDDKGKKIFSKNYQFEPIQSNALSIKKLLQEKITISDDEFLGSIVCSTPKTKMQNHFYTFYKKYDDESVAMIHPQSHVGGTSKNNSWISNQSIITNDLHAISIYQMNHCRKQYTTNYQIIDINSKEIIHEQALTIPSLGVKKIVFKLEKYKNQSLTIKASPLMAANGKPLLARIFKNGKITINHG